MKILVCLKVVGGELNPFDACALEAALSLADERVTVLSMCPASASEKLKQLTRLGDLDVIQLSDSAFAGSDTLATAYILSLAAGKIGFDYIFCGRQTIDGDTAQVGPELATMLDIPLATNVLAVRAEHGALSCHTRDGDVTLKSPALLTLERINTLRFPSLFSRVRDITVWGKEDIGADAARCGLHGSPTKVLEVKEASTGTRKCKMIAPKDLPQLIEALLEKPRLAQTVRESNAKLGHILAIGDAVLPKATALAERVTRTDSRDPAAIVSLIGEVAPDAVLFPADLVGRRIAPIVAATLKTGLCADCTALETDGQTLFMWRPAKSGSVVAKIKCTTTPQMATVRVASEERSLVLSGGRGVAAQMDDMQKLATAIGAELCASRTLVDLNLAPYEAQVGLTGKNANAKVYIAVGISGAVQHTCALENCDTVIAVNPDRGARIFDHADFGIVGTLDDILPHFI